MSTELPAEWNFETFDAFDEASHVEGWALFECGDHPNGPWQIQRFDVPEDSGLDPETYPFDDDADAWLHVWERAEAGSHLHVQALEFLKRNNIIEHDAIVEWCTHLQADPERLGL